MTEDNDGDINRTEDREFVSFFEQATFAFEKGYGPVPVVLDRLDLDLSSPHLDYVAGDGEC